MNLRDEFKKETGQIIYCWNKNGEYVVSGSYSDAYVSWLENKLLGKKQITNGVFCLHSSGYENITKGTVYELKDEHVLDYLIINDKEKAMRYPKELFERVKTK